MTEERRESTGPGTEPTELDSDLLARWIGVSSLMSSAEEMLAREGGAWTRLALVATDAASEALLGLLAVDGPEPPSRDARFEDVYQSAIKALRAVGRDFPAGLGPRLLDGHRLRNAALHIGSEPAVRAVDRAVVATRDLRNVVIAGSASLAPFQTSGPIQAIARFVKVEAVSGPLFEADRLLREGKLDAAADQAAIAFDLALRRVDPPLRPRQGSRHRHPLSTAGELIQTPYGRSRRPDEIGPVDDRLALVEVWVLALGVGMAPGKLEHLRTVLGAPRYSLDPPSARRSPDVVLTREIVEAAILEVADVVFRLWQAGGLRPEPRKA